MTIRIISNGSKWMGQEPDSVETLLEVLAKHALDPTFERYGDFFFEPEYLNPALQPPAGTFRAFGNFFDVSHVFNLEGTAEEMEPVRRAIEANKRTTAYQKAREELAERERAHLRETARRHLDEQARKIREARAVLGL